MVLFLSYLKCSVVCTMIANAYGAMCCEYEWYYEDRPHTPDYLKFNVLGEDVALFYFSH